MAATDCRASAAGSTEVRTTTVMKLMGICAAGM